MLFFRVSLLFLRLYVDGFSELRTTVQPGGKGEWELIKSLALKKRPPKTGVTVRLWPLGKWTMLTGGHCGDGGVADGVWELSRKTGTLCIESRAVKTNLHTVASARHEVFPGTETLIATEIVEHHDRLTRSVTCRTWPDGAIHGAPLKKLLKLLNQTSRWLLYVGQQVPRER